MMKAMKYPRAIPRTKSQEKEKSRSSGKFSASVMLVLGLLSLGVTWSAMPWRQAVASDSCGPCERAYVEAVQQLNLPGGYDAKATVCKAAIPDAPRTSQHPLILGLGPGTTATRSFALAVNNLGKSVLHWSVWRGRNGEWLSDESTPQKFAIDKLVAGLEGKEGNDELADFDFRIYDEIDAVFDFPLSFYGVDILAAYPNAKVIITHRDPSIWYHRRQKFCLTQNVPTCDVPYLIRPVGLHMKDMTEEQAVGAYEATEAYYSCRLRPDRLLIVDAWNPPAGGWFAILATFIGQKTPPAEALCDIPIEATHGVDCDPKDKNCHKCRAWVRGNLL